MRYLLTFLLIAAVQGGIAQNKATMKREGADTFNPSLMTTHVPAVPPAGSINCWQEGGATGGYFVCQNSGGEQSKLNIKPAKPSKPMGCVIEPCHIYDVGPAKPSNVSSDKKSDQDEFHGGPTKTCSRNPYALDACTPQYPLNDGQVQEVSRPDDVYHDTNVQPTKFRNQYAMMVCKKDGESRWPDSDKQRIDDYCKQIGGLLTASDSPAPQPLVEKAVEEEYVAFTSDENCHAPKEDAEYCKRKDAEIWRCSIVECDKVDHKAKRLSCPKRPNFHVFLLPDESTGEKMCVMLPKEK